jgi:hypothetical protein
VKRRRQEATSGSHHRGVVWRRPGGSHGEAGPWPPSGSLLVLVLRPRKIRFLKLISSNSENISCLALWHPVSMLVLEIA